MALIAPSQSNANRKQHAKLAEELWKKTHFKKSEVESLLGIFYQSTNQRMDRSRFRDILHNTFNMTDDIIMDRVFKAFDKDNDSNIDATEWVLAMSIWLHGTLREKIIFCFDVYDMNSDGFISREEMFNMLKNSLVKQPNEEDPDEGIKDLVELLIKRMDIDKDTRISPQDYMTAVEEEPLLLEAFGQCLPDHQTRLCFLNSFLEEPIDE